MASGQGLDTRRDAFALVSWRFLAKKNYDSKSDLGMTFRSLRLCYTQDDILPRNISFITVIQAIVCPDPKDSAANHNAR